MVMDRVKELVQRDPEEAANLVRNWLREDTKSNPRRR
jgi:flagellar biosynthesis/type III secretory pathway M-ring protein FliF/YscJ